MVQLREILSVGRQLTPDGETLYVLTEDRQSYFDRLEQAIESSVTWGDFFGLAPKSEVRELRRRWELSWELEEEDDDEADGEEDGSSQRPGPADDSPFNLNDVPGFEEGDWPPWPCYETDQHLPAQLLKRSRQRVTTVHNGRYTRIEPSQLKPLLDGLRRLGHEVEEHRSLRRDPHYFGQALDID